ncbi:MAG: FISUMP domain-containing protein [Candidatus Gracilibacteria bacterium]|nr:FISUMP domain-containing protein [Candidatus Gracilibacteria bacterium]
MHKQKIHGFTLVELIVVITILAILGTIAFISLQGYSTSARDSTRITDLGAMKTSLELFQLDNGKYPIATNGIDITYSGSIVWNQGTFGETVYANTDKLDKIPLDPITDKQYTYSTTSKRNEFQLAGIIEGGDIAYYGPPLTPPYQGGELAQKVNAGTTEATAYITGNYNGQMTKSLSGVICNILAIPSIITNDTSITDLQQITSSQSFVYRGHKNLPGSFKGSKFKQDGGFEFSPNKLLAYTDTGSCTILSENTNTGITSRVDLLKGLQDAYTGTTLKNEGEIKNILALDIDTNNPSTTVKNYASTFVNNVFGSKILAGNSIDNNVTYSCVSQPNYTNASFTIGTANQVNQSWQNSNNTAPCYYECTNDYTGNDCSVAPLWTVLGGGDCIGVSNTKGVNGNISTCNDTRTYTHVGAGASHDKIYSLLKIEGKWFFNENLAYPAGTYRTTTWSASDLGYYSCPGNNGTTTSNCGNVATYGYLYQWSAVMNGGAATDDVNNRVQGICPSGWAIPTRSDLISTTGGFWPLITEYGPVDVGGNTQLYSPNNIIPSYTGYRNYLNSQFAQLGSSNYFWTSKYNNANKADGSVFYTVHIGKTFNYNFEKGDGFSVRCIKN